MPCHRFFRERHDPCEGRKHTSLWTPQPTSDSDSRPLAFCAEVIMAIDGDNNVPCGNSACEACASGRAKDRTLTLPLHATLHVSRTGSTGLPSQRARRGHPCSATASAGTLPLPTPHTPCRFFLLGSSSISISVPKPVHSPLTQLGCFSTQGSDGISINVEMNIAMIGEGSIPNLILNMTLTQI